MKKVGLYFGSFNPVHQGHLIIAEYFATQTNLDEVWFIVSPHNPLKESSTLASEQHRLNMIQLAIQGSDRLHVSDIEFGMDKPSYTHKTLRLLRQTFPTHSFTLLLGEDNLPTFHLWKEYAWILANYPVRVFPRLDVTHADSAMEWEKYDVQMMQAPRIEISSTQIRKQIAANQSVRFLLPESVIAYIQNHKLYWKS